MPGKTEAEIGTQRRKFGEERDRDRQRVAEIETCRVQERHTDRKVESETDREIRTPRHRQNAVERQTRPTAPSAGDQTAEARRGGKTAGPPKGRGGSGRGLEGACSGRVFGGVSRVWFAARGGSWGQLPTSPP